jgi:hypothetical protein
MVLLRTLHGVEVAVGWRWHLGTRARRDTDPSCHEMGAAPGRRDTALPPVLTRDTLFDIGRIGIDVLAPSETPRRRSAQ